MQRRLNSTRTNVRLALLVGSALLASCSATVPEPAAPKHWQALSRTATGITGDITLTATKLTFANQTSIDLATIEQDANTGQTLYRVTSKTNPELLNGNFICGNKPIDYIVVRVSGKTPGQSDMQLMAYYYPGQLQLSDLPLKDKDDVNRMMCALFTYVGAENKPARTR